MYSVCKDTQKIKTGGPANWGGAIHCRRFESVVLQGGGAGGGGVTWRSDVGRGGVEAFGNVEFIEPILSTPTMGARDRMSSTHTG